MSHANGQYLILLEAVVVNQTSCERFLKAYKNVNSKQRTNMGGLTAAQFNSGEDEDVTRGIIAAQVYMRTNMKQAWQDPCETLNTDDKVLKIDGLDKKD